MAERVGVSPVTVSRCFSNPESVAPKRRELILAAAADLGYFPNRGASLMRVSATGRLMLIERKPKPGLEWEGNRLYDYLFKSTYHGVLSGLSESMYAMTYVTVHDDEQLKETLNTVPMDGIIGMNFEYPDELAPIIASGIPAVFAHHTQMLGDYNRCWIDNFQGGRLAGELLRDTGHRNVAYITYDPDRIPTHGERLRGFMAGLGTERLALTFNPGLGGKEGGVIAAKAILSWLVEGNTLDAIAAINDETAMYMAQVLMDKGISIPRDISMIGFDNNPATCFLPFRLSSLDLNLEEVYHLAVSSLIRCIKTGEAINKGISPLLVQGDSVLNRNVPVT